MNAAVTRSACEHSAVTAASQIVDAPVVVMILVEGREAVERLQVIETHCPVSRANEEEVTTRVNAETTHGMDVLCTSLATNRVHTNPSTKKNHIEKAAIPTMPQLERETSVDGVSLHERHDMTKGVRRVYLKTPETLIMCPSTLRLHVECKSCNTENAFLWPGGLVRSKILTALSTEPEKRVGFIGWNARHVTPRTWSYNDRDLN